MADPGQPALNREDIVARAQASFLGLTLGDAMGATTEFLLPGEIRYRHKVHNKIIGGGWLNLKAGQVTDDTEMSLCIARAIDESRGWDRVRIMELFAEWLKGRPVDVGATCRRSISRYIIKGELGKEYSDWDAGNGAAMRMAPVALFALGDEALLSEQALDQARLTHNNKLSDAACITVGRLVQQAILGADRPALHRIVRELISECPKFQCNRYRGGGASAYVVETLQTVFHYFFVRRMPGRGGQPGRRCRYHRGHFRDDRRGLLRHGLLAEKMAEKTRSGGPQGGQRPCRTSGGPVSSGAAVLNNGPVWCFAASTPGPDLYRYGSVCHTGYGRPISVSGLILFNGLIVRVYVRCVYKGHRTPMAFEVPPEKFFGVG